jgi:uncharacterized protein (TIGR02588 family)
VRFDFFFDAIAMKSTPSKVTISEWIIAAAGALILIGCAIILLAGSDGAETVPVIVARMEKVTKTEAGFLLQVEVVNRGNEAAAEVRIKAVLENSDGRAAETRESVLDYVPAHSAKRAGFYFVSDPRQGRLELQALSFVQP